LVYDEASMTKQQHSLLNRGPDRPWSKALDEPRWVDEPDDVPQPVITSPPPPVVIPPPPPVQPTHIHKQDKCDDVPISELVTAIIVNFKTKNLLKCVYKTFRAFYPTVPMIIVDNHSGDSSVELVQALGMRPHVKTIFMDKNVGHGPAMNRAIQQSDTPYVFTLDTDTEVITGGFLQKMVKLMRADDTLYALGWKRWVDRISGVPLEWHTEKQPAERFIAYVHPSAGLYRVSMYHTLAQFFHHGAPCLNNMREANKRELKVEAFPIRDYVTHLEAGTRRMYSGRWDPTDKTPKKKWNAKDRYPI